MKQLNKILILFAIGGLSYLLVELAYRGHTHWSMFLVGGVCFVLIGMINEYIPWEMPLKYQMAIGALIVTTVEFVSGCYLNLYLGLGIWNYDALPLDILGQVCLPFAIAWYFLSAVAIIIDDYLRWIFFDEEKPHYI